MSGKRPTRERARRWSHWQSGTLRYVDDQGRVSLDVLGKIKGNTLNSLLEAGMLEADDRWAWCSAKGKRELRELLAPRLAKRERAGDLTDHARRLLSEARRRMRRAS